MSIVHIESTTHYDVVAADIDQVDYEGGVYFRGYIVVNKETKIGEFQTPSLTAALSFAARADFALTHRPWDKELKEIEGYMEPEDILPDGSTPPHC